MRAPRRSASAKNASTDCGMDGAIDHRRRRAPAEQLVEKERGDRRAMGGIGELLLLDEGVVVQPVEQLRAVGADDARLRIMDMRVDEAGQDEPAGMIVDVRVPRRAGENVAAPGRPPRSVRRRRRTAPSSISECADGRRPPDRR